MWSEIHASVNIHFSELNGRRRPGSLLVDLSITLSIGREIGVSSEIHSSFSKTRPKAYKQNTCADPKSSNSKGTDSFAYNSDTSNFQDGTCTMVREEWNVCINSGDKFNTTFPNHLMH